MTLWMTENGSVLCDGHRPSSDFRTDRLTPAEVAEWRAFIDEQGYAPAGESPLCEFCREARRK